MPISLCLIQWQVTSVVIWIDFCFYWRLKMEQRTTIKFCLKLWKTATGTSEMFKIAFSEKYLLSTTSVFELFWYKRFRQVKKTMNGFYQCFLFQREHSSWIYAENQYANVNFIKKWMCDWLLKFITLGLSLQKMGV